jgi:DNA adenine methylase
MKPFFKYTGGKTREFKKIRPYVPSSTLRVVEPFAGSCAVSFDQELPAVVGDIDDDVINLLKVAQNAVLFPKLMELIKLTNIDLNKTDQNTEHLEKLYYELRDKEFQNEDLLTKAYRFLVMRQLCFSGMTRFNVKTGKSNVPFGWYKIFQTRLDNTYFELLQSWDIELRSWEKTLALAKPGDWVFLDPPYLDRNSSYEVDSAAGKSLTFHQQIRDELRNISAAGIPWLMVHSDCEFYRDVYANEKIVHEEMFYSQNFKGKGVKNARVGHLYISPRD